METKVAPPITPFKVALLLNYFRLPVGPGDIEKKGYIDRYR